MEDFPPNSRRSRTSPPEEKKVERIIEGRVTRRKKPLGKKFGDVFMAGDTTSVGQYVMLEVVLPAIKDMIVDAGREGLERLIFGENRVGSRRTISKSPTGYTNYSKISKPVRDPRPPISRQARAKHDFEEIVLETRREADEVLEQMVNFLEKFDVVAVADLYGFIGETPNFADEKWGWTKQDFTSARVQRVRDGYLLDLPKPEPID